MAGKNRVAPADVRAVSKGEANDFAVEVVNNLLGPCELELTEKFGQTWPDWLAKSFAETRKQAIRTVASEYQRTGRMDKAEAALPPAPDGHTDQGLIWNSKGVKRG